MAPPRRGLPATRRGVACRAGTAPAEPLGRDQGGDRSARSAPRPPSPSISRACASCPTGRLHREALGPAGPQPVRDGGTTSVGPAGARGRRRARHARVLWEGAPRPVMRAPRGWLRAGSGRMPPPAPAPTRRFAPPRSGSALGSRPAPAPAEDGAELSGGARRPRRRGARRGRAAGSFTRQFPLAPGDRVEAEFEGLGAVEVAVAASRRLGAGPLATHLLLGLRALPRAQTSKPPAAADAPPRAGGERPAPQAGAASSRGAAQTLRPAGPRPQPERGRERRLPRPRPSRLGLGNLGRKAPVVRSCVGRGRNQPPSPPL
jgi:hypothetical protein